MLVYMPMGATSNIYCNCKYCTIFVQWLRTLNISVRTVHSPYSYPLQPTSHLQQMHTDFSLTLYISCTGESMLAKGSYFPPVLPQVTCSVSAEAREKSFGAPMYLKQHEMFYTVMRKMTTLLDLQVMPLMTDTIMLICCSYKEQCVRCN